MPRSHAIDRQRCLQPQNAQHRVIKGAAGLNPSGPAIVARVQAIQTRGQAAQYIQQVQAKMRAAGQSLERSSTRRSRSYANDLAKSSISSRAAGSVEAGVADEKASTSLGVPSFLVSQRALPPQNGVNSRSLPGFLHLAMRRDIMMSGPTLIGASLLLARPAERPRRSALERSSTRTVVSTVYTPRRSGFGR